MKNILTFLIVLSCYSLTYAQLTESQKVIKELLYYIKPDNCSPDLYYIKNYSLKTFFDKEEFKSQTITADLIPEYILKELEQYPSKGVELDINMFEISDMSPLRIYKNNTKRPKGVVYSFTNPLFDKVKKHCVITVIRSFVEGAFISESYFLVKVYGKWIVVDTFDHVIT